MNQKILYTCITDHWHLHQVFPPLCYPYFFLPRRNISLITDDGFSRLKQLLNNVMMIKKHPVFQLTKCNIVKMFHRKKNTCIEHFNQIISYLRYKVQTFYVCVSQLERFHTDRTNVNELWLKITSHYHKSAFNI